MESGPTFVGPLGKYARLLGRAHEVLGFHDNPFEWKGVDGIAAAEVGRAAFGVEQLVGPNEGRLTPDVVA